MEGEFLNGDLLRISVIAEDVEAPVLGISFYLKYESENVSFLKYEPGEFLERGGDPFYLVQNKELVEKIIFGETLRRNDAFPIGGGKVADFYFQILNEGEFNFLFEKGIVSTLNHVRQDLDLISWEDLSLGREDEDSVISFGNVALASTNGIVDYPYLISGAFIALALGSAFLLIFVLKKREKKRQRSSVNFKSGLNN